WDVAQAQWIVEPDWHARDRPHELAAVERFAERGGTVVLIGARSEVLEGLGLGAGARGAGRDPDAPGAGASDAGGTERVAGASDAGGTERVAGASDAGAEGTER